ncbi:MAG: hypothetical protein AAFP13_00585 [Pseudomonadota bacterium]
MFKKFAIAAALAATAGAASANNNFGILDNAASGDSYYDVRVVSTLGEGTVQIETFAGDVLGMASVNAGANTNVRVDFGADRVSTGDLVAKLIVNGEVVDEESIDVLR